ncbi:MATE family efflux transporter [Dysosmobacter sp.]|uniref:MATE family efflux transporter n=1 Tax=Dysosmobacter sp. TaxID=2591382 RepID=UPI002AA07FEA|nr:MATE family efflux transporter [Dysosmobacter sp.]MDY5612771.1 MATE family efflux transporter [Dysosmobacter sp.]
MTLRVSPQTRRVFRLSLPIFAELLLQLLVGNVDQFMLSGIGSEAVAAVGNGNQVMNVVIIVLETVSAATTILLTQHIGAGRTGETCNEIATVGVAVSGVFSLLMGLILLLAPHLLFGLLRTPAEAFDGACLYTRIVGGAVLIQGLYIELCAILRSYTLLKEVVAASVVMNLVNVAGNVLLINGLLGLPRLGVVGAAIATCLSKAVGLGLVLWVLRRKCRVRFSTRHLRPFPAATCKRMLGIAMPSGTEALSYNVSQIVILRFINLMGTTVIATKVYASMLANVAYVYAIAVSQATQIIIGYMLGAKRYGEVERRVWSTIRISLLVSELLTLVIFLFCDPIYSIFTRDPAIHTLGRQIVLVEFSLEIGRSVNITMTKALTAAGDVWYPVIVGIFSMWLVAVLGGWLLGSVLQWGLVGIWIAMACDEGLRGALFVGRFHRGAWRNKQLVD